MKNHSLTYTVGDEGNEDWDVEHPSGCTVIYREGYYTYTCLVAYILRESGIDSIRPLSPGVYEIDGAFEKVVLPPHIGTAEYRDYLVIVGRDNGV